MVRAVAASGSRGTHLAGPIAHHDGLVTAALRLVATAGGRAAGRPGALPAQHQPRSSEEMGRLAQSADQVTIIPGRLGLHQEFGSLLAQQMLQTSNAAG